VIEPVTVPPEKTRRQAVEENVADASCQGCHSLIDPLGFSLEHYDTLGDYRTTENGLPIDSSGNYEGIDFSSIDDLSGQLLARCETQACFARHVFEFALASAYEGSPPAYEESELAYVTNEFVGHYLALAPLLQGIATTPAFLRE